MWGLGRVAAEEYRDRWGGLVDLPPVLDERAAARLCGVLAGCGEDQVAIRAAGILARRLARAPLPRAAASRGCRGGSVLVTGGTGALAGHVARWLAGRGAPRVVLASRSGPAAPGAAALAAELAGAGTAVAVIACDVAERAQVAGLLARIAAGGPPLAAVIHTAGVLDDGVLDGLDAGPAGVGAGGQGGGRGAPGRADRGPGPGAVRAVLLGRGDVRRRGAGQLRGGERVPGRAGPAAGGPRAWPGCPWPGGRGRAGWPRPARRCGSGSAAAPVLEMDPGLAIKALDQALDGPGGAAGRDGRGLGPVRGLPQPVRPRPARRRAASPQPRRGRRPAPGPRRAGPAAGRAARPGPDPGADRRDQDRGRRGARARLRQRR